MCWTRWKNKHLSVWQTLPQSLTGFARLQEKRISDKCKKDCKVSGTVLVLQKSIRSQMSPINLKQHAKYLGQRTFISKLSCKYITALLRTLKWLVKIQQFTHNTLSITPQQPTVKSVKLFFIFFILELISCFSFYHSGN